MRMHTDKATCQNLYQATQDLAGVHIAWSEHGSRTHRTAFEVSLSADSGPARRNSGNAGAGTEYAATWDTWGVVIARLYEVDPSIRWGSAKNPVYSCRSHFHMVTGGRFLSGEMPEDTHTQHRWDWTYSGGECKKCSASFARSA